MELIDCSATSLSRYYSCFKKCPVCSVESIRIRISDHYAHASDCEFSFDDEKGVTDKFAQFEVRLDRPYTDNLDPALVAKSMRELREYDEWWAAEVDPFSFGDRPHVSCPRCGTLVDCVDEGDLDPLRRTLEQSAGESTR